MAAGEETVFESVGMRCQTFLSFSPTEEGEKEDVHGVLDYAGCFPRDNGWEAGLSDGLGFIHNPL